MELVKENFYTPKENQPVIGSIHLNLYYDKKTGKAQIKQTGIGGVAEFVIYEDGVWKYIPGAITSAAEKRDVHTIVKELLKTKIFPALKVDDVKAQFVLDDSPSRDESTGGTPTISSNSTGIFGEAIDFLGAITGPVIPKPEDANFKSINLKDILGAGPYKYPLEIDKSQDRFKISQYFYEAPNADIFKNGESQNYINGIKRGKVIIQQNYNGTVILPMPNQISDTNSVNWGGGDSTNTFALAGAANPGKLYTAIGAGAAGGFVNLPPQVVANIALAGQLDLLTNPTTPAAARAMALKMAGVDVPPETILARAAGVVPNSNLELLFNGPTLRSFTFSYKLSPRSEPEAIMVRKIIRFFKQGMAARKNNSKANGKGGSSFLLGTPNVFKLEYCTGEDTPISGLNKFKECALTQFTVNYAPEGHWAAYKEGQPVSYTIAMTFNELEPVYDSDYQEDPDASLSVTAKDIGY